MSLVSLKFIGFIFATVLLYYLVPSKYRWTVLLTASIVFYVTISPWGIIVLLVTALCTYWSALRIQKSKDEYKNWLSENKQKVDKETRNNQKKYYEKKQNRHILFIVVLSVGMLFFAKYLNPMLIGIKDLLGTEIWTAENIILPLGISYYSLQLISYIVDVKRDLIRAESNPFKVILFGVFFLSIMQGPFNRYNDLMPQLEGGGSVEKPSYRQIKFAILRIVAGYIKKMCIADQVGLIASEVFSNYQNYSGLGIILGVVAFSVQLYADFSGYMDIVCGIGELLGIKIPENFKQPFFARTISEFWQKWHITLGLWLKDYVFYPILKSSLWKSMGKKITSKFGKNAGRAVPTYLGMLILWTLIGLWHGAGLTYVFGVGVLQFTYIFIGEISKPITDKWKRVLHIREDRLTWHIFQSLKSTVLMMFAWIFFNSKSFIDAVRMCKKIFAGPFDPLQSILAPFFNESNKLLFIGGHGIGWIGYIIVSIIILIGIDLLHEKKVRVRETLSKQIYPVRLIVYLALIFAIIVFGSYGGEVTSNFIYFEF